LPQDEKPVDAKDEATGSTSATPSKKERKSAEPSSFKVPNMTRVTPLQLPLLSFPSESRYVPVRPLGQLSASPAQNALKKDSKQTSASTQTQSVASGSIVLLRDTTGGQGEGEYVELDKSLWPEVIPGQGEVVEEEEHAPQPTAAAAVPPINPEEEAGMPEPFEYPFED
jgi:26S proteasome regulatory subunit N2